MHDDKILDLIQREWNLQHYGSLSYIWESKLRSARAALKKWVKEYFENPNKKKIKLQSELAAMQSRMEVGEMAPTHLKQEKELCTKILNAARKIEEVWRIKSRQMWLKGGDRKTEYFHKQTKVQQSYNVIKELKDNHGNKITLKEYLKEHAFIHYQELYADTGETDPKAQVDLLHSIPSLIKYA